VSEIKIAGTTEFVQSANDVLAKVRSNLVGGIIASSIEGIEDRDLTIVPFDAGDRATKGACNASARRDSVVDALPKGLSGTGFGKSAAYAGHTEDSSGRDLRYDRIPNGVRGTGKGSDSHIHFSPETAGHSCPAGAGSLADETLFHEMVHALRQMQGKSNPIPTESSLVRYDNEEEYLAIVVTNVYMSANNKTQLRADHYSYAALDPSLSTSSGFLANPDNWDLMNIYKLVWQPTFWLLATVATARFNPFRELTLRLNYVTGGRPFA
jgi:hypothetical protein